MEMQTKGKIFLADERGWNETNWFQSRNTFNLPAGQAGFGKYHNEHKQPFGELYLLNDDMLAGGMSVRMLIQEDSYVVLLPISGAIVCKQKENDSRLVAAGQVLVRSIRAGEGFKVSNPFKNDTVNFLQFWIKAKRNDKLDTRALTYENVNKKINELIKIFPGSVFAYDVSFSISIGKFSGRGEAIYKPKENKGSFLFVLQGAFEAQGRLLHERDGLALWEFNEIEMEALSNDAMVLVIETNL